MLWTTEVLKWGTVLPSLPSVLHSLLPILRSYFGQRREPPYDTPSRVSHMYSKTQFIRWTTTSFNNWDIRIDKIELLAITRARWGGSVNVMDVGNEKSRYHPAHLPRASTHTNPVLSNKIHKCFNWLVISVMSKSHCVVVAKGEADRVITHILKDMVLQ